jgi:hypothetical protein
MKPGSRIVLGRELSGKRERGGEWLYELAMQHETAYDLLVGFI